MRADVKLLFQTHVAACKLQITTTRRDDIATQGPRLHSCLNNEQRPPKTDWTDGVGWPNAVFHALMLEVAHGSLTPA